MKVEAERCLRSRDTEYVVRLSLQKCQKANINKVSSTCPPAEDLNSDFTNGHSITEGENLSGPQPYRRNYGQLRSAVLSGKNYFPQKISPITIQYQVVSLDVCECACVYVCVGMVLYVCAP